MRGDGNGFVQCGCGHRHWGRYGAAGLLLTDGPRVLLQHRAAWTHEGGTWAVPGGARDSHEDALAAALREAAEETSLDPTSVRPFETLVDDHGRWSYTTVLARPEGEQDAVHPTNPESDEMGWWPVEAVDTLALHRGFALTWPRLRALLTA